MNEQIIINEHIIINEPIIDEIDEINRLEDNIIDDVTTDQSIIDDSLKIIKNCYLCNKLFKEGSDDSIQWISCEKCDNWVCGSCSKGHQLCDEYYCSNCKQQDYTFSPIKTSSPNPPKTTEIRQLVRINHKRAAEKMIEMHDNKKLKITIEFNVNDKVTVKVNKLDRLACDMIRIPAIIIKKSGNKDIFYQLATTDGILNTQFRACDLDNYFGDINIDSQLLNDWKQNKKTISIREASRKFNNHKPKKVDLANIHCACSGKCFQDKRCKCFSNNQPCSSHCQNHVSGKKSKCLNSAVKV